MKIGDVVTIKSNPYFENITGTDVYISGEHSYIPPSMVVSEILYSNPQQTCVEQVCVAYFDTKENKFKIEWYKLNQLKKLIDTAEEDERNTDTIERTLLTFKQTAQNLILKNTDIELHKKRINRQEEANGFVRESIDNYYNHLPPVLTVIDYKKVDEKRNNPNKRHCQFEVKCKWFNPKEGKMSEVFLPSEILSTIKVEIPSEIKNFFESTNKHFIAHNNCFSGYDIKINETSYVPILKFVRFRFLHYKYYVDFINILNDENITVELLKITTENIDLPILNNLTLFEHLDYDNIIKKNLVKCEVRYSQIFDKYTQVAYWANDQQNAINTAIDIQLQENDNHNHLLFLNYNNNIKASSRFFINPDIVRFNYVPKILDCNCYNRKGNNRSFDLKFVDRISFIHGYFGDDEIISNMRLFLIRTQP